MTGGYHWITYVFALLFIYLTRISINCLSIFINCYSRGVPNSQRVDTILKWLNGSEEILPDLMLLYFDKVDKAGHEGGPGSEQVNDFN